MTSNPEINIRKYEQLLEQVVPRAQPLPAKAIYATLLFASEATEEPVYEATDFRRLKSDFPAEFEERLGRDRLFREGYQTAVAQAAYTLHSSLTPGQDRTDAYNMSRDLRELVAPSELGAAFYNNKAMTARFGQNVDQSLTTLARGAGSERFDTACDQLRQYAVIAYNHVQSLQ